jgi:hypothetical protein
MYLRFTKKVKKEIVAVFRGLIVFEYYKHNYGMVRDVSKNEGNEVSLVLFLLFELNLLGC